MSATTRLVTVDSTGSTNDDLRQELAPAGRLDVAAADRWPHGSALRALAQTAGRGRGGRDWVTPPGGALTVSFVLRPLVPASRLGWLPLLAGLAVRDALVPALEGLPWCVRTKWPNDVVVEPAGEGAVGADGEVPGWGHARKIAGILAEFIPAPGVGDGAGTPARREEAPAIILGIGVNAGQPPGALPVPWAASLRSLGAGGPWSDPGAVLGAVAPRLLRVLGEWEAAGGDPEGALTATGTLGQDLREACATLGARVRVSAPDGEFSGTAVGLEPGLRLRPDDGGPERLVMAGDASVRAVDPPGRA
ncbi:biotin--[acetyl-CoA-carboxylase] ligase [Actinomyces sp. zg328]|uniref:biotin--[acetyl-CoA-carboxylase] ligase n=1 Tax=Actinomyces sp. zg328 TaxID=2609287 RepID=UPI00135BF248|nr:biotin--[acetyl-CoA-carboxylase] ligase [Actinomyces sp. zg328]